MKGKRLPCGNWGGHEGRSFHAEIGRLGRLEEKGTFIYSEVLWRWKNMNVPFSSQVFTVSGARIKVLKLKSEDHLDPPVSTYEAEVEFLNDCQLKEGRTAFWSPGYHPGGGLGRKDSPMRPRGEPSVTQFKEGQRQVIRGFIDVNRPRDFDPAARKVLRDKNRISTGG